jgi:hypothetical protein
VKLVFLQHHSLDMPNMREVGLPPVEIGIFQRLPSCIFGAKRREAGID